MQKEMLNRATIGQASNMAHAEYLKLEIGVQRLVSLEKYMVRRVPLLAKLLTSIQEDNL